MLTKRIYYTLLITLWLFASAASAVGQTIGGTLSVCNGYTSTLTGSPVGGVWSTSAAGVATVGTSSGIVTGVSVGTATITYDIGTGFTTATVTINASPGAISGAPSFCEGGATTFTNPVPGGNWSSSSPAIVSISSSGVASGVTAGSAIITYLLLSTGCMATDSVTVNPLPGTITGTTEACNGSTTTLYNSTAGGTWSSSTTAIATIGSLTGIASGISSGTTTISYSLSTGCYITTGLTVDPTPSAISGTATVCAGYNTLLNNATPGGTWSSGDVTIAVISSTGVVTGIAAGTANITYTLPSGCVAARTVTVNATPNISGSMAFCNGTSTLLTGTIAGGTWTSSNTAIALFTSPTSGILTGVSAGNVMVTYTLPTGCYGMRTDSVLVAPSGIIGSSTICPGATTTLNNTIVGGTWASSNPATATIGVSTGIATGIGPGVTNISYTLSNGCYKTISETVNPTPAAITGTATVCIGAYVTLSSATPGGTWSSSSTAIVTVSTTTGVVSGISPGAATISYMLSTGCYATRGVTVSPAPSAGSTPTSTILCIGATTTISSTVSGGAWSSSNPSVATIGATSGIVTGVAAGTATATYSVTNSCGTAIATTAITVSAPPTITGVSPACTGLTSTLSVASGCGTWSTSSSSVASVSALSTSLGVVTGVSAGTATISFTTCVGCVATSVISISAAPPAIIGSSSVCLGSTTALEDSVAGGIWSSSNPSVATITIVGTYPGTVTGISTGTAIMTYSLAAGCIATRAITVNPLPLITASGTAASCGGDYILTASGGSSYSWVPTTGISCGTCATTNVTPTATLTYTVTGTGATGCSNKATVVVNGNRIYGHISFSGATPAATDMKVWLIQYNSSDSSIIALDSTLTCLDSTLPYYQFNGKPAGEYLVKAKLLSSIPGTSDYFPTYGYSSAHWNLATSVSHVSASDSQHIHMMYGTVLSGPGFIGGYVFAGAGKGTASAAPVAGILVYLKNVVTGVILNYTYTDASGHYSFPNLPYGNYFVAPEEYGYYTTPSSILSVSPTADSVKASFKKHTDYGTITPNDDLTWLGTAVESQGSFSMYPNPCSGILNIELPQPYPNAIITITDAMGRTVYERSISDYSSNPVPLQLQQLQSGLYIISVNTGNNKYTNKFTIQ